MVERLFHIQKIGVRFPVSPREYGVYSVMAACQVVSLAVAVRVRLGSQVRITRLTAKHLHGMQKLKVRLLGDAHNAVVAQLAEASG